MTSSDQLFDCCLFVTTLVTGLILSLLGVRGVCAGQYEDITMVAAGIVLIVTIAMIIYLGLNIEDRNSEWMQSFTSFVSVYIRWVVPLSLSGLATVKGSFMIRNHVAFGAVVLGLGIASMIITVVMHAMFQETRMTPRRSFEHNPHIMVDIVQVV